MFPGSILVRHSDLLQCIIFYILYSITTITSSRENVENDTVEDLEPVMQVNNHIYQKWAHSNKICAYCY